MNAPRLSEVSQWKHLEREILSVLRSALVRLRRCWPDGEEPKLNRVLYACFLTVNRENYDAGGTYTNAVPILESRNSPRSDTEGMASEGKLPDLQVKYMDHQATDALDCVRSFTIECKRLGQPPDNSASLSSKYVSEGVCRFVDSEWSYGYGSASGAMVGYIESGTPSQLAPRVNRALEKRSMPALQLPAPSSNSVTEMDHRLDRPFPIRRFRLVHLWVEKP